jgi:hypothetical protein
MGDQLRGYVRTAVREMRAHPLRKPDKSIALCDSVAHRPRTVHDNSCDSGGRTAPPWRARVRRRGSGRKPALHVPGCRSSPWKGRFSECGAQTKTGIARKRWLDEGRQLILRGPGRHAEGRGSSTPVGLATGEVRVHRQILPRRNKDDWRKSRCSAAREIRSCQQQNRTVQAQTRGGRADSYRTHVGTTLRTRTGEPSGTQASTERMVLRGIWLRRCGPSPGTSLRANNSKGIGRTTKGRAKVPCQGGDGSETRRRLPWGLHPKCRVGGCAETWVRDC